MPANRCQTRKRPGLVSSGDKPEEGDGGRGALSVRRGALSVRRGALSVGSGAWGAGRWAVGGCEGDGCSVVSDVSLLTTDY